VRVLAHWGRARPGKKRSKCRQFSIPAVLFRGPAARPWSSRQESELRSIVLNRQRIATDCPATLPAILSIQRPSLVMPKHYVITGPIYRPKHCSPQRISTRGSATARQTYPQSSSYARIFSLLLVRRRLAPPANECHCAIGLFGPDSPGRAISFPLIASGLPYLLALTSEFDPRPTSYLSVGPPHCSFLSSPPTGPANSDPSMAFFFVSLICN